MDYLFVVTSIFSVSSLITSSIVSFEDSRTSDRSNNSAISSSLVTSSIVSLDNSFENNLANARSVSSGSDIKSSPSTPAATSSRPAPVFV